MEAAHANGKLSELRRNLVEGYRLAVGRAFSRDEFVFSLDQVFLLVVVFLSVVLASSFIATDPPIAFNAMGLNYLGAVYLFNLVLFLLVVRLASGPEAEFGVLLTAFVSAYVPVTLVMQLVWQIDARVVDSLIVSWTFFMLALLWEAYVLVRLIRGEGKPAKSAVGLAVLYVLVSFGSLWVFPHSQVWYTDRSDREGGIYAEVYQLDIEDLYYSQARLMQRNLAALEPERPGVTDLYFMGIGGYVYEDVFLKEVEYVRRQFDEDYGTQGRSMLLVNNLKTLDRYPLANRHNLHHGLSAMASKMDLENDVLFLFLTSHGSSRHRLSFEMGPAQFNDLTPQHLRAALDASGIQWRVIVVSSCYSGGFIEALKDPGTVVITAAAKDKTSFGCGARSDFTDFGTAYFKEALQQEPRFVEAFDIAKQWVTEREIAEKRTPSEPQRFVGEAVEPRLAALYEATVTPAASTTGAADVVACTKPSAADVCPSEDVAE